MIMTALALESLFSGERSGPECECTLGPSAKVEDTCDSTSLALKQHIVAGV